MKNVYTNSWEDEPECDDLPMSISATVVGLIRTLLVFGLLLVRVSIQSTWTKATTRHGRAIPEWHVHHN